MMAGELYVPRDPALADDHARAQLLLERFNSTRHPEHSHRRKLLEELFGEYGAEAEVKPPLRCDYGWPVKIGRGAFINTGCVLLDAGAITIGAISQIGPGVQILTASHPVDPALRREGLEFARPVILGENVWVGAGAIICPGVTVGPDSVVGAGAVVTRDVPAGTFVLGVPARIRRSVGGEADADEHPTAR
jgi:maltose O-acetyltransferase